MVDLAELGRRIRKLRVERRQTLKHVEQASGLSSTHLSEIERGRTSPTIGALVRIARALGRDASYFIEPDDRPDVAYCAREKRGAVAGVPCAQSLSPGIPGGSLYPYRIALDGSSSGAVSLPGNETGGDVTLFVTRGRVLAQVGTETRRLGPGDSLQATLRFEHRLRAEGSEPAEVIAVLTRPLGGSPA